MCFCVVVIIKNPRETQKETKPRRAWVLVKRARENAVIAINQDVFGGEHIRNWLGA